MQEFWGITVNHFNFSGPDRIISQCLFFHNFLAICVLLQRCGKQVQ